MAVYSPGLTVLSLVKGWLQRLFHRWPNASLRAENQTPWSVGEETKDACRNFELIFIIEEVQEHVDGDNVRLARPELAH